MSNIQIRSPLFKGIVEEDVQIELLGTGFEFTEGPVWNHIENHLIFSDIPGNTLRKWTPDGAIQTIRKPSNMANGNSYDHDGRLVTCEHATSRVTRTELDGSTTVLATHHDDKELNSPNDIVVRSDGSIYFTDPSFGRMEYYGVPREMELSFKGVYRLDPKSRNLTLLASDFEQPNGLCFSLDESKLYVNDTMKNHVRVFDVNTDGSISNSRVWAEVTGEGEGVPDGMKVDSKGNLCTTGPGGVHYFGHDGTSLGVINVPEHVSNFTWGEDDLCSMIITASTSIYRVRVKVPGNTSF